MKVLTGYLIDRETGVGIASKDVDFLKLDGTAVTTATTYAQSVPTTTDGNGRFSAWFELSPGPVNVVVDAIPGVEVKVRKHDEKAQFGYSWSSDISRFGRAFPSGVVKGFLNELALSVGPLHQINVATGAAVFNGSVFSIENSAMAIAGTANPAGPANPRLDLITLRQYNETAAGQDAGRQAVVVTLGSITSVVPATPTGSDFIDYPIGVVSTALGAAGKTIYSDLRTFTSGSPPVTSYQTSGFPTILTLTIANQIQYTAVSGPLIPSETYDGYLYFTLEAVYDMTDLGGENISLTINDSHMIGGAITSKMIDHTEVIREGDAATVGFKRRHVFTFFWPVVGVTGVTSLSLPIELSRSFNGGGTVTTVPLDVFFSLSPRR